EPGIVGRADDIAWDGTESSEGRPRNRRARAAPGDRGGPGTAAVAPRAPSAAGAVQGGDGVRPDRARQPRRALRPRAVRESAERDLPVLRGAAGPERDDVPGLGDAPRRDALRPLRRGGVPLGHDYPLAIARSRRRHEYVRTPVHR